MIGDRFTSSPVSQQNESVGLVKRFTEAQNPPALPKIDDDKTDGTTKKIDLKNIFD